MGPSLAGSRHPHVGLTLASIILVFATSSGVVTKAATPPGAHRCHGQEKSRMMRQHTVRMCNRSPKQRYDIKTSCFFFGSLLQLSPPSQKPSQLCHGRGEGGCSNSPGPSPDPELMCSGPDKLERQSCVRSKLDTGSEVGAKDLFLSWENRG